MNRQGGSNERTAGSLLQGLVIGLIFGALLQKAGVTDFDVLVGVLRLTDLTVMRVIGSAIVTGGFAIYLLRRFGAVRPHVKPTHYASNSIGGILFGLGFGISGYCPGTGAAAFGQGNWDAGLTMIGMVIGSYAYALGILLFKRLEKVGDRGNVTIADMLRPGRPAAHPKEVRHEI